MGFFSDLYKSGSKTDYERSAFNVFISDYLKDKRRGPTKSKEFTAMDMETTSPADFVPSMFYTFMYDSPTDDTAGTVNFKDAVPLILCATNEGGNISGINFNLIPCDARAGLLDLIIESNTKFYSDKIFSTPEFIINTTFANSLIDPKSRTEILRIFDNTTGLKISNCYRVYNKKYIKNSRLIEYDVWKYIPFLVFKDAVRGASLAEVQANLVNISAVNK